MGGLITSRTARTKAFNASRATHRLRARLEAAIEKAIAMLDALDTADEDREDDEREPERWKLRAYEDRNIEHENHDAIVLARSSRTYRRSTGMVKVPALRGVAR